MLITACYALLLICFLTTNNDLVLGLGVPGIISKGGPYKMTIKRFEKCPDEGNGKMLLDFHLKRGSRTTVLLYGTMDLAYTFDENIKLKLSSSVWGNGGWRKNTFILTSDRGGCSKLLDLLGDLWIKIWASANYTLTDPCKIPAGHYDMKGVDITDIQLKNFPFLLYSSLRNDVFFYSQPPNQTLLGCLRSVFEITPKI